MIQKFKVNIPLWMIAKLEKFKVENAIFIDQTIGISSSFNSGTSKPFK